LIIIVERATKKVTGSSKNFFILRWAVRRVGVDMTFGNANSPVSKQKLTLHPKLHPKKPTTKCWDKTL